MRAEFYQVIGTGPCPVDYPDGNAISHRPGEIIQASPTNKSVIRALRTKRLRQLSEREAKALRASQTVSAVKPTAGPPPVKPTAKPTTEPGSAQ